MKSIAVNRTGLGSMSLSTLNRLRTNWMLRKDEEQYLDCRAFFIVEAPGLSTNKWIKIVDLLKEFVRDSKLPMLFPTLAEFKSDAYFQLPDMLRFNEKYWVIQIRVLRMATGHRIPLVQIASHNDSLHPHPEYKFESFRSSR